MATKFIINTDGASRGNPGPAAGSFIICDQNGMKLDSGGIYVGFTTNNEAEYLAVNFALKKLLEIGKKDLPCEVLIKADSLLIVNQLSGRFKIKNSRLKILAEGIRLMEKKIGKVIYNYIPRTENKQADRIANQILDLQ